MGKSVTIKNHNDFKYDSKRLDAIRKMAETKDLENILYEINRDIANDFYADARGKLTNLAKNGIKELAWRMQALLEIYEYNFNKADALLNKSAAGNIRTKPANDIKLKRGLIYFTKGDFDIAEGYFADLLCYHPNYLFGFKYLLYIEIIKGNYHTAKKILDKIAPNWNNERMIDKLYGIINLKLGQTVPANFANTYLDNRLNNSDVKILVDNLKLRYLNGLNDPVYVKKFVENTNFYDLIAYCIHKMSEVTKSYENFCGRYIIRMDDTIGYVKNNPTSDVCVRTFGPTDKILSIEPIQLSKNFDKEGYSLSRKK